MICDLIFIIFPYDWWMQIISVYISMSISRYIRCAVLCWVAQSCPTLCNCNPPGSSVHEDSPGKNTRVGRHVLHQGIFQTHGLNPGLPHCRQIFYHLSHQGSPRILTEVVSLSLPNPGIQPGSPALKAGAWKTKLEYITYHSKGEHLFHKDLAVSLREKGKDRID